MEKVNAILTMFSLLVLLGILMSFPTQFLWNSCLVPAVDGVNHIGLLQAFGLNLLASILLRSSASSKNN